MFFRQERGRGGGGQGEGVRGMGRERKSIWNTMFFRQEREGEVEEDRGRGRGVGGGRGSLYGVPCSSDKREEVFIWNSTFFRQERGSLYMEYHILQTCQDSLHGVPPLLDTRDMEAATWHPIFFGQESESQQCCSYSPAISAVVTALMPP